MKDGYRESLYRKKIAQGKTVNASKLAIIAESIPENEKWAERTL